MPTVTHTESGFDILSISFCSDFFKVKQQNKYLRIQMKELIEIAEKLYKKIDKAQVHLINARLQKDDEGKKSAISEMETAMCDVSRLLKCFIERKDNIVDLSEVWHDITEEPKLDSWFLGQIGKRSYDTYISAIEGKRMREWFDGCNIKRWAYIDDLLPKGGE